jgi:hypothetical protein
MQTITMERPVLSISMEDADERETFTADEALDAIRRAGFDLRRASTGHVFLLNVQDDAEVSAC